MKGETTDFQVRRKGFLEEYSELVTRYRCDFMSQPIFEPNQGRWDIVVDSEVVDITEPLVKSPFSM